MSQDIATGHDPDDFDGDPWNETEDDRRARLTDRLKATCRALRQDFDSVQIVCTNHEDRDDGNGQTQVSWWGSGNWYARVSSAEECLEAMKGMFNGGGSDSSEGD